MLEEFLVIGLIAASLPVKGPRAKREHFRRIENHHAQATLSGSSLLTSCLNLDLIHLIHLHTLLQQILLNVVLHIRGIILSFQLLQYSAIIVPSYSTPKNYFFLPTHSNHLSPYFSIPPEYPLTTNRVYFPFHQPSHLLNLTSNYHHSQF